MAGGGQDRGMTGRAVRDFARLVARAFFGGVGVAVAMALAILALTPAAHAAPTVGLDEARAGRLLLHTDTAGRYEMAPQVGLEVAVQVTGMVARTRVSQSFRNPGRDVVEALYVFPLPEKAAVDHLWVSIGERRIEGRVQEKAEARRTYEKAKAEGRKAALVEQRRPNLFTNAVAHVGPGETVVVVIEYQQSLTYDAGTWRLRFPLAVTPRYTPDPLPDEPKAAEALHEEPLPPMAYAKTGQGPANTVDIAVVIDAGVPVGEVRSSYHDVMVHKAGGRAQVLLTRDQEQADRDFELTWRLATGAGPQGALFAQRGDGTDYALLMVVPPQPGGAEAVEHQRMARETIFVVDTSGSMQGASMEQARQALELGLDTLRPGDRFNVIEFNSKARALFPDALPASPTSVEQARRWVRDLKANGGTEMAAALQLALDGRDTPGFLRQVVFVTDGAVGNEESLFRLIAARLGGSRLFTVGIGSAPNGHFMTKAAQFGRGTFTYIGDVREVREKMSGLFERIEAPVLRDVKVRLADGTPLETYPERVPDLYLGEPIVLSAAVRAPLGTVVVSGLRGNQPWSVALTPLDDASSRGVGALWARARIAELMDRLTRGAPLEEIRPKVVEVALEHHLVSAYTSLVAVDVTPTAPAATPRAALVKASLPLGSAAPELPQTDLQTDLQLLLGVLALGLAALVAALGVRAGQPA